MEQFEGLDLNALAKAISAEFLGKLPPTVSRRVQALQKLQDQYDGLEKQYQGELRVLAEKYSALYNTLWEKRASFVNGAVEPTDEDVKVEKKEETKEEKKEEKKDEKKEGDDTKGFAEELQKALVAKQAPTEPIPDGPGIPGFWLRVLKNHMYVAESITEKDEGALKFLTDVKCNKVGQKGITDSFTLEFHFADNEYFTNKVLTKTYHLAEDNLYSGPDLDHAEGCKIDWKPNKNLTVVVIQKKQRKKKGKGAGTTRVIETVEKCDSFFNFFSPPNPEDFEEEEEEDEGMLEELLDQDYTVGCLLRDLVIPAALHFYTGEAIAWSGDSFLDPEVEDFDDEEEDEDEDEDDEPELPPTRGRGGRGGAGRGGAPALTQGGGAGGAGRGGEFAVGGASVSSTGTVLGGGPRGGAGGRGGRGGRGGAQGGAQGAPGANPFQPENPAECKQQ
eukprot:TRINITY_DN6_c0_g1_i1.p1 TRINITY_DN6_c0_g1~~TRINITY_DN6_c0_g1_i1.p1  ORF type:complete len:466 (-),score=193.81 TRINITY_DN6_c0_g1_i1:26-1366(-)